MKTRLVFAGVLSLAAFAVQGGADWAELNAAARRRALSPVRLGEPGVRPFWNGHSKAFIHPPAFEFKDVPGAANYRFTLEPEDKALKPSVWIDSEPWKAMDAAIWDALVPGFYTVKVEALDSAGSSLGMAGTRRFWRAAVFSGPYPQAARTCRDAARRVYAAIYRLPYVQAWLDSKEPPAGYDLYCYPAKMLSSMIDALCRHSKLAEDPVERMRAIDIACRMADWMISQSQREGTVLAHFPPTYWGDRRDISVKNAGLNMLRYPSDAAMAYFNLADALELNGKADSAARYRSEGFAIVSTYVRLQEKDGTWPLKVREVDGKPTKANRLVPERHIFVMFDRAIELKGDGKELTVKALESARAAAFGFLEHGPLVTWNWDGQFEDMDPMPPYMNLQKGAAIDAAAELFKLGRNELAIEIVDWCEDQFTVWSDPYPHMDWKNWKTPTALEQYDYYTPIDASMADMVRGFMMAYKATGDLLYKAKALALANCIVRYQREDGTIPTYFDSRRGSDWANCMIYVATVLETVEE